MRIFFFWYYFRAEQERYQHERERISEERLPEGCSLGDVLNSRLCPKAGFKNIGVLAWWHKPVIPPTWEAEAVGLKFQGQPGQLSESVFKIKSK